MSYEEPSKEEIVQAFEEKKILGRPIGFGDIAESILSTLGITEERFKTIFGLDECRCQQRKQWLNDFVTLYWKDRDALTKE